MFQPVYRRYDAMQTAAIAFDRFKPLQDDACEGRILAAKAALGKRAVILGHHYQRADVYKHADLSEIGRAHV